LSNQRPSTPPKDLAAYHLSVQRAEIDELSNRTQPFDKQISGMTLTVFPRVYPGGLDTELLCEVMQIAAGDHVVEIGTGTGAVALKAARAGAARVVGVDLNPDAVRNAEANRQRLGLNSVEFREGPLFEPVAGETFDVIAINPPYTNKKPANKTEICFWDEDNQLTKAFFANYAQYLNPGGRVYFSWADFADPTLLPRLAGSSSSTLELIGSRATPSGLATFCVYSVSPLTSV